MKEVALILKMPIANVRTRLVTGKIKGFKFRRGSSHWKIKQEDLEHYIDEQKSPNSK